MNPRLPTPKAFMLTTAAIFALLPLWSNPYLLFVANLVLVNVLLATGLNLLIGFAGQIAFANAALFGIGAYACGLLRADLGLPFWLAMPAGTVIAALLGSVAALPALRLQGPYLAFVTLAFAYTVQWILVHWEKVTYGAGGFRVTPLEVPQAADSNVVLYYLTLAVVIGGGLLARRLVESASGRTWMTIREDELLASTLGIDVTRTKIEVYALSAAYAGAAGALFAPLIGIVSPESFGLLEVIRHFAMVAVGGMASLIGSLLGALIISGLAEPLRGLQELQEIAFGLLLLVCACYAPGGIAALLASRDERWRQSFGGVKTR
jgi:branched-chain amino acid transport system permease protein